MSSRRGKKINPEKNAGSARDFAAGKVIGRPKQSWIWDQPPVTVIPNVGESYVVAPGIGHWEKVNGSN